MEDWVSVEAAGSKGGGVGVGVVGGGDRLIESVSVVVWMDIEVPSGDGGVVEVGVEVELSHWDRIENVSVEERREQGCGGR